ncbi:MAG: hypothetical protein LUE27_08010 [Clostridia bacterium]|nr:hypothetical protein [Clostridia bacterium]
MDGEIVIWFWLRTEGIMQGKNIWSRIRREIILEYAVLKGRLFLYTGPEEIPLCVCIIYLTWNIWCEISGIYGIWNGSCI